MRIFNVSIDDGPTYYFVDLKKAEEYLRKEGFVERAPIDFKNEAKGAWKRLEPGLDIFSHWPPQYAYIGWITTQDEPDETKGGFNHGY